MSLKRKWAERPGIRTCLVKKSLLGWLLPKPFPLSSGRYPIQPVSGVEPERGSMILLESHSQGVMGGTLTCAAKALILTMLCPGSLAAMALSRLCCMGGVLWLLSGAAASQWVCECGKEVTVGGSTGYQVMCFLRDERQKQWWRHCPASGWQW